MSELQDMAQPGAAPTEQPLAHKITLSQATLDLLEGGLETMLERRATLAQQIRALDVDINKQQGGIEIMRHLLANAT